MIKSITIKKVATFDDIGATISDLKKVNFFFGYNASGKSTIAKYLYNLSLEASHKSEDFNDCSQEGYIDAKHQILVFDVNFTEINFNKSPSLKGIFSLNQANDVIDKQIASKEAEIKKHETFIETKKGRKEKIEKDKAKKQKALLDYCWGQRTQFDALSKISLSHAGSKQNNLDEIKKKLINPLPVVSKKKELIERYQSLYEKEIKEVNQNVNLALCKDIQDAEKKLMILLQERIVGNEGVGIAKLIREIEAESWVETGVRYIEHTGDTCPFCQKNTIDENLKEQFNKYFDKTYKEKINKLVELQRVYKQKANEFLSNIMDTQKEFNPNNTVSDIYLRTQEHFITNIETISEKIQKPDEQKSIASLSLFERELLNIVKMINENNKSFLELHNDQTSLVADIWKYIAVESQTEIKNFKEREKKYQRVINLATYLIDEYESKIVALNQTIGTLKSQTVNTTEAVDNINLILKSAGFGSFEIAEAPLVNNISQYYLKRQNGALGNPVFKSLSEGEKNFISFLYFFQLCVGTNDRHINGRKKIIVIDDPVSSLDSQALFVVSTLVRNLILGKGKESKANNIFKNDSISQVFILTHNLYFYKEVSLAICADYWHYRIIKIKNKTSINGEKEKIINDDYSLLWSTIKEWKSTMPTNTSLNIAIANTMRRIIESYVNFIGLGKNSWAAVLTENQAGPLYYIKCAFISTINDESHKVTVLDNVYYQKIINEQPQTLFDVFTEIFKSIGKEHYESMMGEQVQP